MRFLTFIIVNMWFSLVSLSPPPTICTLLDYFKANSRHYSIHLLILQPLSLRDKESLKNYNDNAIVSK